MTKRDALLSQINFERSLLREDNKNITNRILLMLLGSMGIFASVSFFL